MSVSRSPAAAMYEEEEYSNIDYNYESKCRKPWLKTVHLMTVGGWDSVPETEILVVSVIGVVLQQKF